MGEIQKLVNEFFEQFTDTAKVAVLKLKLGKTIEDSNIFIPSVEFEQYLICMEKHNQAKKLLEKLDELSKTGDLRAIHESRISKSMYQNLINSTLNTWISLGFKNEIEKIIAETA